MKPLKNFLPKWFLQAFTLIELIIVITILAILSTIAFVSYENYTASSRNTLRTTDIKDLSKSIALAETSFGKFPTPDNSFLVTYSGGHLWTQGTIEEWVVNTLRSSTKGATTRIPTDPVSGRYYKYSIASYGKTFQIAGDIEQESIFALREENIIPTAIAADPTSTGSNTLPFPDAKAYLDGSYGGIAMKTEVAGDGTCVIASPSILTSTGTTGISLDIKDNSLSGTILFHKKASAGIQFNPQSVYCNPAGLPTDDSTLAITHLGTTLQTLYAESPDTAGAAAPSLTGLSGSSLIRETGNIINGYLGGSVDPRLLVKDCTATTQESYTIPVMKHAETKSLARTETVTNGEKTFSATFTCSDGTLSHTPETSSINCTTPYVSDGTSCVENKCAGLPPPHAHSNASSEVLGTSWSENTNPGVCTFVCDANYTWSGATMSCLADIKQTTCGGNIDPNGHATTPTTYTQTWNGTIWNPSYSWTQSGTPTICNYACNTNYTWNAGTSSCTDQTPPTITSVTTSTPATQPACNTVQFTIVGATDVIALHATPYSFDGGTTWQAGNTKGFTTTSQTLAVGQIKVRDAAWNIYTYPSASTATANDCLVTGACASLPINAVFYNSTTSYSLVNAPSGTTTSAVTAWYSATPTVNTCQWKCDASSGYDGVNCIVIPTVLAGIATPITTASISWNWRASPNATRYEFSTDNTNWVDQGNVLTKRENLLTSGTTYTRYIRACNSGGCSASITLSAATNAFTCGTSTVTGRSPDTTVYKTVLGADGRCWLASNLGTDKVATAYNDTTAYGWLYQWGRLTDGHQLRTSGLSDVQSTTDVPGHANYIKGYYDWRTQNDTLSTTWGGIDGTYSPCPVDWRLPTQSEWANLVTKAGITNYTTAFNSSLKLPLAGGRSYTDGGLTSQGTSGYYLSSSTVNWVSIYIVYISMGDIDSVNPTLRGNANSVRCIKN